MDLRPKMNMKMTANSSIPRVRVWPANEENRRNIVHPTGIRFRDTVNDSVEWPMDTFTKRRLREGDVLAEAPEAAPQEGPQEEVTQEVQGASEETPTTKSRRGKAREPSVADDLMNLPKSEPEPETA